MVTLRINGKSHQIDVPSDMPVLWVLRDVLGMTGTKFGCGMALCGACTVQLDGQAIRSAFSRRRVLNVVYSLRVADRTELADDVGKAVDAGIVASEWV